jgi:hypothetical protein
MAAVVVTVGVGDTALVAVMVEEAGATAAVAVATVAAAAAMVAAAATAAVVEVAATVAVGSRWTDTTLVGQISAMVVTLGQTRRRMLEAASTMLSGKMTW